MIRAHSFDVFDTLLVRTWARPADIRRAAAERVVAGPRERPGRSELVAEVARRRHAAEFQAMDRLGLDAVGLDAIYAELEDLRALGVDPDEVKRAEIAIEREEVRPVRAGAERVKAARAAGRRVLFVSDMYLPAASIREALERFGIRRPEDPLYVSGELGIDKRRGGLFGHVLSAEGLQPSELIHTGDDPHTDILVPRRLGIGVEPFTPARLNRFEAEMLFNLPAPREVTARLVGASRAARVAHFVEGADAAQAATIGANVAGPLFAGYVSWVLRCAREEGIERLYFVSRDTQVLTRIAGRIAREGDPECRYLYGSRQAWLLAGVDRVDREALHWLLEPDVAPPRVLLAKLEIDADEVAEELAAHGLPADTRLADDESLDGFWAMLSEVESLVLERAERARALTSEYLEQEGLHEARRWALVDIGWRLTTQRALRRVLAEAGGGQDILGFYLALSRKRTRLASAGAYRAFVIEDDEAGADDLPESWLWDNVILMEQVLAMADHGSCTGYRREDGRIVPVLREMDPDSRRAALCAVIQASIVECAEELHRGGLLDEHAAAARAAGLLAGRLLTKQPLRDEAAGLGWLPVTDDQNETRTKELAPPLALGAIWLRVRERLGRPWVRDFDTVSRWPEGSWVLARPSTRALYRALLGLQAVASTVRRRQI